VIIYIYIYITPETSGLGGVPSRTSKKSDEDDGVVGCLTPFASRKGVEHGASERSERSRLTERRVSRVNGIGIKGTSQLNPGVPGEPSAVPSIWLAADGRGEATLRVLGVRKGWSGGIMEGDGEGEG